MAPAPVQPHQTLLRGLVAAASDSPAWTGGSRARPSCVDWWQPHQTLLRGLVAAAPDPPAWTGGSRTRLSCVDWWQPHQTLLRTAPYGMRHTPYGVRPLPPHTAYSALRHARTAPSRQRRMNPHTHTRRAARRRYTRMPRARTTHPGAISRAAQCSPSTERVRWPKGKKQPTLSRDRPAACLLCWPA